MGVAIIIGHAISRGAHYHRVLLYFNILTPKMYFSIWHILMLKQRLSPRDFCLFLTFSGVIHKDSYNVFSSSSFVQVNCSMFFQQVSYVTWFLYFSCLLFLIYSPQGQWYQVLYKAPNPGTVLRGLCMLTHLISQKSYKVGSIVISTL